MKSSGTPTVSQSSVSSLASMLSATPSEAASMKINYPLLQPGSSSVLPIPNMSTASHGGLPLNLSLPNSSSLGVASSQATFPVPPSSTDLPASSELPKFTLSPNPQHQMTLYHSLVYMAEQFRARSPPQIRMSIHCLKSILLLNSLPTPYLARTYLQVARLVWQHTPSFDSSAPEKTRANDELVTTYLNKAIALGTHIRAPEESIRLEAIDLLAELYEKRGRRSEACEVLNQGLSLSRNFPYWHCRYLFRLAQARVVERELQQACDTLNMAAQFAHVNRAEYARGLFLLSKCMVNLCNKQIHEYQTTMQEVKEIINTAQTNSAAVATASTPGNAPIPLRPFHKETLITFSLVLEVSYSLMQGKAKSAREPLKLLQQHLSLMANMDEASGASASSRDVDHFQWLTRDQLSVLVYLLSVMQNVQSGIMDRAERYAEKALHLIEKVSYLEPPSSSTAPSASVFSLLQLSLVEQVIACRLIMGHKALAAQDVARLIHHSAQHCLTHCGAVIRRLSNQSSSPTAIVPCPSGSVAAMQNIMNLKRRIHCVLGLFAMSMNHMDEASKQFALTMKVTQSVNEPLYIFCNLHLALVFLRQHRLEESAIALNEVEQHLPGCCFGLQIAYQYVRGFHCMFLPDSTPSQYKSARFHLRECLRMSLEEDLTRITANTLSTLGQVAVNLRDFEEAKKMIEPASQLADRIPDVSVQLWTSALLKDVYAVYFRDKEKESHWYAEHDKHSKLVISDHLEATSKPEKQWIEWLGDGLPPVV